METVHILILPRALTFSSNDHGFFSWPRLNVGCLTCVWFCSSRLRKASGRGRAGAGTQPVNPLKLGRPC